MMSDSNVSAWRGWVVAAKVTRVATDVRDDMDAQIEVGNEVVYD